MKKFEFPLNATMGEIEKAVLLYHVRDTNNSISEIARILKVDYRSIYNKLEYYGIPKRKYNWSYYARARKKESARA